MSSHATHTTRRRLPLVRAAALGLAIILAPSLAHADRIKPPSVPANLQVPAGNKPFFQGHGVGTQNYVCLPSTAAASGFAFVLFTPQATLFDDDDRQLTTHYFSPNPFEDGTIRATWQHARDGSTVWAKVAPGDASTDAAFVAPGAVAWLKLTVVGAQDGATGGDKLTGTTFLQRVRTAGGLAPSTGCASLADVGHTAFVPYTADYIFYTDRY
ncbi:MAG: DUF3455 domain-containing protein [Deltaproteobacteria bacterium]|nr:DUF3455 domain-containing protein [Deltaproteobacteria bacterium]